MTRRTSPLAALAELSRSTIALLGALSALKALALIGIATAVTETIVATIGGEQVPSSVLGVGAASVLIRGVVEWAHRVVSARAALGVKERLRAELAHSVLDRGEIRSGSVTSTATTGLDALDSYFASYLPSLMTAMLVPVLVGLRILAADWVSALIIVLTVPLIPVFMVLIGLHTREAVARASADLGRLSDHLVELAKGLPVLVGLGRAEEQATAMRELSDRHRRSTVATLKTAFLSSLALELIGTISVAVVAVFIGVRLVSGDLPLSIGLLVLILAPECFAPFREVGSAFHAAQDGQQALADAKAIIESDAAAPAERASAPDAGGVAGGVAVRDLTVRFADRSSAAIGALTFIARPGRITLLDGRSGSGKSSVLMALVGRLAGATVGGSIEVDRERLVWLPQHPRFVADTVLGELLVYADESPTACAAAPGTLERLGLGQLAQADPALISPGEQRRLAFARVLMRVDAGADVVLLDEPTAQLDGLNAGIIIEEIEALRLVATVILSSHDAATRGLADDVVSMGSASAAVFTVVPAGNDAERQFASPTLSPRHDSRADDTVAFGARIRALGSFLAGFRWRLAASVLIATAAALFAIALTAVSGWLIVRASEHPPIMYLLVAIVGVRFFGIGRGVLRYSERLVTHDAAFRAATTLRVRLWSALSAGGLRDRDLLGAGAALDRLVVTVDEARDLAIRVIAPLTSGVIAVIASCVVVATLVPGASPWMLTLVVTVIVVAPSVAIVADRASQRGSRLIRSVVVRRLAGLLTAADDLRGNRVDAGVRSDLSELDRSASTAARRSVLALGLATGIVVAVCSAAAMGASAAAGGSAPGLIAVAALVPLALIESAMQIVSAAQLVPSLLQAVARSFLPGRAQRKAQHRAVPGRDGPDPSARINSLSLDSVAASWDDEQIVVSDVTARVSRGEWLAVSGPSGSGKSTILAVLLGQLQPAWGSYLVNDRQPVNGFARRIGWCPQEAHLFDSTLRGNLLIARSREEAPDDAELIASLEMVGLGGLLATLPSGLDTRLGSDGARLSAGERQRVAVARTLLTGADVILLDEPTAHLDGEAASGLMADLRAATSDRIVVLVTHQREGVVEGDRRIQLGVASPVLPSAQSHSDVSGPA